ncbi:MAG: Rrf2 family transcriptional regulator [Deltaproteobacteria bacterium]|nr:Rrf2 family transcriptional regulator [Deltaproteobacteria bacterium]
MRVSATDEYGLRCLLQVAFHEGPRPMNTPEIARREGLGPEHVGLLMQKLRLGGLVTSTRGAAGGYRLARPANEISVWEVISVVGGEFLPQEFCECHSGRRPDCAHVTDCSIRALWRTVEASLRKVLQGITLADLQRDETSMVTWLSSPEVSGVDRWN